MGRLFGTDGARGIANTELTCELAMNIGRAAAHVLANNKIGKPKVIIGKDTRISSSMLENALTAGLCSVGADVVLAGYVPTPAIAFLVSDCDADCGIMISASHNSFEFNGIKLFSSNGYKLPDSVEEEIEKYVLDDMCAIELAAPDKMGDVFIRDDYVEKYIDHVCKCVNTDLSGLKIAIDCSNGSASVTAEKIFKRLGADCYIMSDSPNGININDNCGSTHMERLIHFVNGHDVDLGLAFDGDADRCLAVDENGEMIDGDKLIAIFSLYLKDIGRLNKNTAVVTVMSNLGFKHFAKANGINVAETSVGDRYVLEKMVKEGYVIGGEQSGHIIFKEYATTGDGQLSGAMFASIIAKQKIKASVLADVMHVLPQTMINVKADKELKAKLNTDKDIIDAIESVKNDLGDNGRILVRASGTEPIVRVMLEGTDISTIKKHAKYVADIIESKGK